MAQSNLFDGNPWTPQHSKRAIREGWDIFDINSTGALEIQRNDDSGIFNSDAEAVAHVRAKAAAGSVLHMRALLHIAEAIITPICRYSFMDSKKDDEEMYADLIRDASSKISTGDMCIWGLDPAAAETMARTNQFSDSPTRSLTGANQETRP